MKFMDYFRTFKRMSEWAQKEHDLNISRERKYSSVDAADDLMDLMFQAITELSDRASGSYGQPSWEWRHLVDSIVYSGAFSARQIALLEAHITTVSRGVAERQARVWATRVICGGEEPDSRYTETLKMTGAAISRSVISGPVGLNVNMSGTPWK